MLLLAIDLNLGNAIAIVDVVFTDAKCSPTAGGDYEFIPGRIDAADFVYAPAAQDLPLNGARITVLESQGSNHDPLVRETAQIDVDYNGQASKLPLYETGPDTGVFAGTEPDIATEPGFEGCNVSGNRNVRITLSFSEDEFSYASSFSLLIDPMGYIFIFDSQTGALIDGAVVTLLDENDQPVKVFGDDGVSAYPVTVISGGMVTDASGRVYDFSRGNYRFPLTYPGRYHLKVEPPALSCPKPVAWSSTVSPVR